MTISPSKGDIDTHVSRFCPLSLHFLSLLALPTSSRGRFDGSTCCFDFLFIHKLSLHSNIAPHMFLSNIARRHDVLLVFVGRKKFLKTLGKLEL